MSNEVAKYHNDMNAVAFRKFNARELDLFFTICAKIRDEGMNQITFSFDELKTLSKHSSTRLKEFSNDLKNTYDKMLQLNFEINDDNGFIKFVLFNSYQVKFNEQQVIISVNQPFSYILNELTANFTRFELEEFVDLKSTYSKTMYRLLKQFRTTGFYRVSIDDFRRLLDIPKSYRMTDINSVVLKPITGELSSKFKNLRIKKITAKKGRKIEYLEFLFDTEEVPRKNKLEPLDYQVEQVDEQLAFDELEEMLKDSKS